MDIKEAIEKRHSVRQYLDKELTKEDKEKLTDIIDKINKEQDLNFQLITDDPKTFDVFFAHYGNFKNVKNYIALVGKKTENLDERCGYYGQEIVLEAQMMGLNTCWMAGTYSKGNCRARIADNEKLVCVIAIGYGETSGTERRTKPVGKLCDVKEEDMPEWFKEGVKAAQKAPTAINQQKFKISLDKETNEAVITAKKAAMAKIDLGIVKYNFEMASGKKTR